MVSRGAMLADFLQRGATQPFDWGARNCGLWVCDWIALVRGIDPAADLRGRFKTATGLGRHIARLGGIETFARGIAGRAELVETKTPVLGDAGLIEVPLSTQAMAIADGHGNWLAKTMRGIVQEQHRMIVGWTV